MNDFSSLGLSQPLLDAISDLGYIHPTPIQENAIPKLLEEDTDFVGLAQTGTGKTAAFGLPLIQRIKLEEKQTQGVVLAPTRELCLQITNELQLFSKKIKGIKIHPVYGGADIGKQIRDVKKGVHIIVATPGRLKDLIKRKAVNIKHIDYVILDEADEMLNMGFKEEIDDILSGTPDEKITWLFSATMPREVRRIAKNYMTDPFELSVGGKDVANKDIEHQYVIARPADQFEVLRRFLDFEDNIFGLVFTRTRMDSKRVADKLQEYGYNADALNGDLNQAQRDRVMGRFRKHQIKILVATDVAARGIDVDDITHVFHFNIPDDINFYTHRSGRTARAGKKGISLILAHPKDMHIISRLERHLKTQVLKARIPTGREIFEKQLVLQFKKLKEAPVSERVTAFLPKLVTELEDLSKEELIEKFASYSINASLEQYLDARDINEEGRGRKKRQRNLDGDSSARLFINIGQLDVEAKPALLSLICGQSKVSGASIGKIEMSSKHSFFDVEESKAKQVILSFKDFSFEGRPIRVNQEDRRPPQNKRSSGRNFRSSKGRGRVRTKKQFR